jgi:asparagine synthase (glutamine-hydrolysing)
LTKCDGEALIHLYNKGGIEFMCENLYGVFGFILLDTKQKKLYTGRDTFGVRPVFKSFNAETGTLAICSEAKGLVSIKQKDGAQSKRPQIEAVLPGSFQEYNLLPSALNLYRCEFVRQQKFHVIGWHLI